MPIGKQQQHTARLSDYRIVDNYRRQVLDKKQHVKTAIAHAQKLSGLIHTLHFAADNQCEFDVFGNHNVNYTTPHQLKKVKAEIVETRASLAGEEKYTRQVLIGFEQFKHDIATTPTPPEKDEDEDWTYDNVNYCDARLELFKTQLESLNKLLRFLAWSMNAASQSQTTIKDLAQNIRDGQLNVWNAENHGVLADMAASMSDSGCETDVILSSCYGLSYYFADANFQPSSVVKPFIFRRRRVSMPHKTPLPRNRVPVVRRRSTHGSAIKSGDDGDGDGDGDGEPPRPRSPHSPTPPLHHSLTHHSLISWGAQW